MLLNIILNIYQNGKNQNISYYKFDTKLYAYIINTYICTNRHLTSMAYIYIYMYMYICIYLKDRNGMDLTEAEDIKKRWQEYTEELYKKDLHDPDNHDGVITHPEPDNLECEVKWALASL